MSPYARLLAAVLLVLSLAGCGAGKDAAHGPGVDAQTQAKASSPDDGLSSGEWSASVGGLRGRLLIGEDAPCNGTRMAKVYLELQNVSDVANQMEIYFDTIHSPLKYDVLDPGGKVFPQAPTPCDIMTPNPYWIRLPFDAVLRFRVSLNGYGIPRNGGWAIGLDGGFWIIPPTASGDYFLTGSFSVIPLKDGTSHPWQGVLELPKARIPVR